MLAGDQLRPLVPIKERFLGQARRKPPVNLSHNQNARISVFFLASPQGAGYTAAEFG
jgi:hypothetical protein